MKRWQFWFGILVSILFSYLALRGLDLAEAWKDIRNARFAWLIPGVLVYFFAVWARTWRWHCLLYTSPSPRDRTRSRMPSSA